MLQEDKLKNTGLKICVILFLALCPVSVMAQSVSPDALLRLFKGNALATEIFPGPPIRPPYIVEVWVDSVHGLHKQGSKILISNCLRQDLEALGDVKFVPFLSSRTPRPCLRLRVWFSQKERMEEYQCYDTTLAVVLSKVNQDNPLAEYIIDAYALAGIAPQDLNALSQEIATRLNVKMLSALRRMNQAR